MNSFFLENADNNILLVCICQRKYFVDNAFLGAKDLKTAVKPQSQGYHLGGSDYAADGDDSNKTEAKPV